MSFKNNLKVKSLALWMVVVPMVLALIYFSVFAVDRYVSSAQTVVRQADQGAQASVPGLALLMGGVNPASREETLYLRQFITSTDMLKVLEQQLNWRAHYARGWADPLYWLSSSASAEDLFRFYQRLVQAHYDELTGLLTIEVQALSPDFATQMLDTIFGESERFVNEMSHKIARDQLRFAEAELLQSRQRYEEKKQVMLQFQSSNELLNAQTSAESRAIIIGTLEADLTRERATLTGFLSSLGSNTPQVRQQRNRIRAIEQQLAAEKKTLVSSGTGEKLNVIASQYRNLEIDVGIAEEAYKSNIAAVENARIEASKKIRSLVKVVSPNVPEDPIYPRRIYNLFTLLLGLLLLYGVTRFVLATIEDHRD